MKMKSININHRLIRHIVGSVARTLLSLTFLFSGFVKAVDPLGTVYKVQDYLQEGFGHIFQWAMPLAGTIAVLLIVTELVLGICMLLNVRTRWTSWITLVFYLIMTPITLYIAIANPVTDCGCFGDALVITNWQTFYKNVVLLALAITLVICRNSVPALFSWWVELGIALLAIGASAGIMAYCYTHLPIIDFRPYKVGNNVYELCHDEVRPEIAVIYTYEQNGVEQEFSYADRPEEDSTWHFVRQETRVIKEGKEPTITDFLIEPFDPETDINEEDLLFREEPVTLIAMYDLYKANEKLAKKAVQYYKQLTDEGQECYIITNSGDEDIYNFMADMELEPTAFLLMDKKPIETMVRANPGVIVFQNGIVVSKQNMRQVKLND